MNVRGVWSVCVHKGSVLLGRGRQGVARAPNVLARPYPPSPYGSRARVLDKRLGLTNVNYRFGPARVPRASGWSR